MIDFPEMTSAHVAGAKLFANRHDMIAALPIPPAPVVAEVGVALGEFSKYLVETLRPAQFHAFDLFQIHRDEMLWGRPTREVLGGQTHADFYRNAMSGTGILMHEGPSAETLKHLPDKYLDLAYIDAQHTYEGVLEDARECARAAKEGGILVFNDYILHDPFIHADYGVVPVVNQMVVNEGWRVIGFALQKHLFCDIALQRATSAHSSGPLHL